MDEAMIAKIHDYEQSDLPERIKLALRFTEGWVMGGGQILDDELIERMKAHFTEAQIVELALYLVFTEGMQKFNATFEVEAPPGGQYQLHSRAVPAVMKQYLESLGCSLVGSATGFDANGPAKYRAIYEVDGDDIEASARDLLRRARTALDRLDA